MGIKLSLAKNYLIHLCLSRVFHRSVSLLWGPWKLEEFYAIISFHSPECTFETFECPTQFLCFWSCGKTQLSTEENLCKTEQGDGWAITMLFDLNTDQPRTVCVCSKVFPRPPTHTSHPVWRLLIPDKMINSAWVAGSLSITNDKMLQKQREVSGSGRRMKNKHTYKLQGALRQAAWVGFRLWSGRGLVSRPPLFTMAVTGLRWLLSTYSCG